MTTVLRRVNLTRLAMEPEDVAGLTASARRERVAELVAESHALLDYALEEMVYRRGKELAGICGLFSGGNDSTTLCHVFRDRVTHLVHANTTIGIEATRVYVRETAQAWGIELLERTPDERDQYASLVREQGFPGPGHHFKMFQRLKERGLRKARNELVAHPRRERVVYLAGRRRTESDRRANVPEMERDGSIVWVSPLVNWTKLDMNTYRVVQGDVPSNPVAELLHMSGECLCGAFAKHRELDEIGFWFPEVAELIWALEEEIAHREDIPEHRRMWGWGGDPDVLKASRALTKRSKVGRLCSSCAVA